MSNLDEHVPPWETIDLFRKMRVAYGNCGRLRFQGLRNLDYFIIDTQ